MNKAASYARRSKVWKKGLANQDSVDQQEAENIEVATNEGWELPTHRLYRDNDISARKDTIREDWIRLNQDIEGRQLDILILWESSRGDREPDDWIGFLAKCQRNKVRIHVTSDERTYNLDNISDWRTLAIAGIESQVEVLRAKNRTKRHMKDRAKKGLPHSRAPYGYEIYALPPEIIRGTPVHKNGRRPVQPEADIAVEVIKRIAKSEAVIAIVKDLDARGIDSPSVAEAKRAGIELSPTIPRKGREINRTFKWSTGMVRKICMNVAYIGKLQHEDQLIDAQWEGIIDEETFWAAHNVLTNPARKTTKPGAAKHLLSHIMKCGHCGSQMGRKLRGTEERYQCHAKGCTTIRMEWVDNLITKLTCQRLAKPDVFRHLQKKDNKLGYAELEALRAEHTQALDMNDKGELSLIALGRVEKRVLPRIAQLEAELRPVNIPQVVRDLVSDNVATIRRRWEAMSVSSRKEVIRTLYASITLAKAPLSYPRAFGERLTDEQIETILKQRVHLRWAGDDDQAA